MPVRINTCLGHIDRRRCADSVFDTLYDYKGIDGAEGGGSILVAGDTGLSVAQLQQDVMAEWASSHTYPQKVANILGPGALNRLNGSSYLQPGTTVTNDAAADVLWGSTGGTNLNWFLASTTLAVDTVNQTKAGETQTNTRGCSASIARLS